MSLVKRSERVTNSWKGALADIAIRSMPNAVERLLVTDRPIILTAIKTMKPTISTIFLENIDMLCCAHSRIFCGEHRCNNGKKPQFHHSAIPRFHR